MKIDEEPARPKAKAVGKAQKQQKNVDEAEQRDAELSEK